MTTATRTALLNLAQNMNECVREDMPMTIYINEKGLEVNIMGAYEEAAELADAFDVERAPDGVAHEYGNQIALHHQWSSAQVTITHVVFFPARSIEDAK